jgi:hypothetical protein
MKGNMKFAPGLKILPVTFPKLVTTCTLPAGTILTDKAIMMITMITTVTAIATVDFILTENFY